MNQYVAFLRAINVGGRRVQMDWLATLFEEIGLSDVDTYLASGNVVFRTQDDALLLEEQIEGHLARHLDYEVPTFVRSMAELVALLQTPVFEDEPGDDSKRYVVFLKTALGEDQSSTLGALETDVDRFVADGREVFWHRDLEGGESMPTSELESALDVVGTRRTLTTIERIVKQYR